MKYKCKFCRHEQDEQVEMTCDGCQMKGGLVKKASEEISTHTRRLAQGGKGVPEENSK